MTESAAERVPGDDILIAALKEQQAEIERLRAVVKEVDGCWRVYEPLLRGVMGHTNYNVIARKLADAMGEQEQPQ